MMSVVMFNVANNPFSLSVVMLSVIMLSVMAPRKMASIRKKEENFVIKWMDIHKTSLDNFLLCGNCENYKCTARKKQRKCVLSF